MWEGVYFSYTHGFILHENGLILGDLASGNVQHAGGFDENCAVISDGLLRPKLRC